MYVSSQINNKLRVFSSSSFKNRLKLLQEIIYFDYYKEHIEATFERKVHFFLISRCRNIHEINYSINIFTYSLCIEGKRNNDAYVAQIEEKKKVKVNVVAILLKVITRNDFSS